MVQLENGLIKIVDALNWEQRSEFTENVLPSRYLAFLRHVFADFLKFAKEEKVSGVDNLREIIKGVSEDACDKILVSPVVSAVLRELHNQNYPPHFLEMAVMAFSAWFLIELREKDGDSVCAAFRVKNGKDVDKSHALSEKIPVDFDFPHEWQHLDVGVNCMDYVPDGDRLSIIHKLEDGVRLLKAISPLAAEFTLNHTNVVLVRVASEETHSSSSSNLLRNGATMVRNIHFDSCTAEVIADFLLHEAIHHCLYKFEIVEKPFVCALTGSRQPLRAVKSLWSGHRISSDSFLQACFVWFGLWRFWTRADKSLSGSPRASSVAERRRLCAFGFIRNQRLSEITTPSGLLPPDFLCQAIDEMQDIVCSMELN